MLSLNPPSLQWTRSLLYNTHLSVPKSGHPTYSITNAASSIFWTFHRWYPVSGMHYPNSVCLDLSVLLDFSPKCHLLRKTVLAILFEWFSTFWYLMASGPITSWQIDGETVETVADFIFLGSKITADGDCSHEIKRRLLLGRKVMTNLDSILRSTDITLSAKVRLVKAMVFPLVMYGCEGWTIKKAKHWRIDAFELWYWKRLLRVPWTARKSNQSTLKEISRGCSLVGLMLKLKLQYLGHLMRRADSFEKTLMLGKIEGRRRRGWQRIRWLYGITPELTPGVGDGQGGLACCGSWGCRVGHNWATELNWGCY